MADDRSPNSPRRAAPGEDPAPAATPVPGGSEPGRTAFTVRLPLRQED